MRPTDEREKVLNMHFIEKKSAEKICAEVGIPLGKVLKLMRRYSLLSVIRRRRLYKYVPNGNLKYANVLNRDFYASRPNQKWVTDISYIITEHGTLYLSAIRDLFDNFIISYKLSKRQNYDLVGQTIKSALDIEKPRGGNQISCRHHVSQCRKNYPYNGQLKHS